MSTLEARREAIVARNKIHLLPAEGGPVPLFESWHAPTYEEALVAAGGEVLAFEEFGTWQGDWWAYVALPNGERVFIKGAYGSCSGCDAAQAELGELEPDTTQEEFSARIRAFGRGYFEDCMTMQEALDTAGENASWDSEAEKVMDWVRKQGGMA